MLSKILKIACVIRIISGKNAQNHISFALHQLPCMQNKDVVFGDHSFTVQSDELILETFFPYCNIKLCYCQ